MQQEHHLTFGPFRLDVMRGHVWQGQQLTTLRPRSLAMLRYLVEHPGRLVTKAELRQHVWAGTHVTDTVLRVCVQEIRAALHDDAAAPQYLETVGRQGYRLLMGGAEEVVAPPITGPIVGRQAEVEAIEQRFQRAAQGARQLVFVSGEAGLGKTTVVDMWLARLGTVRIARGQCVEHYGEGEPYLPVLEALGQLSREPGSQEVLTVLRRYAPMWLVQLPGLLNEVEQERLQRQVQGATATRMLRELAEALEVLTAEAPMVLVLEDLHWSDPSTVGALAYLAQRRQPARLLILGTYRPVELVIRAHPLRGVVQELCGRGQATELRLEFLTAAEVAAYVAGRLGGPVEAGLATFIHARTDGNALFMVNVVEHLIQKRLVVRRAGEWTLLAGDGADVSSLPEELHQMLIRRIEALAPEVRQVLEVASVVGDIFAVATVAAGAQRPEEEVDATCEGLAAQHHFIDDIGLIVWPDGTRGGNYRFQHALYQQVLYKQMGTAKRMHLHQRLGRRLEAGYGARAVEIAAQLALHFERGGETAQAVSYWQQAAENATRRNAYPEAIAALRKGLVLLATLPVSQERTRDELALQLSLGQLLMAAQGVSAPEAGDVYTRAHALCQPLSETPQLFRVLSGLFLFHAAQARLRTSEQLGRQLFDLAQRLHEPAFVQESHLLMGGLAFYLGNLVASCTHLEQSLELSAVQQPSTPAFVGGLHPTIVGLAWLGRVLWLLGYVEQAHQRSQEAVALAQQMEHTPSLALAEYFAAMLTQHQRDIGGLQACAEALMTLADAQEFALRYEQGRILRGWALAMRGDADAGVAQIRQGLAAYQGTGSQVGRPSMLAFLAEACGQAGTPEAGLTVLAEALTLVEATEERWWEAELYRLQGVLQLQLPSPDVSRAEACLQQALAVAHNQQAKALELRAALSLSRLWQQQGKRAAARDLLAPIYGWFTEGFETPDLQEAQMRLAELA